MKCSVYDEIVCAVFGKINLCAKHFGESTGNKNSIEKGGRGMKIESADLCKQSVDM